MAAGLFNRCNAAVILGHPARTASQQAILSDATTAVTQPSQRAGGMTLGRLGVAAVLVAASLLLSACAGTSGLDFSVLGAKTDRAHVHFPTLLSDAERSKLAYASESAIRAKYPQVVRVATPGDTDVQYFLERDDRARIQRITIRGTVDKANITEDFDAKVRLDPKAQIPLHEGFDRVAQTIYADARPYLKPGYKTYLTGHSLGGAAVAVLAITMRDDGHVVERVATFGQPRVTTTEGTHRLGTLPLIRVVDENDVVPMIPPDGIASGGTGPFAHGGPELILLDGERYVYLDKHDAKRLETRELWRSLSVANLADHDINRYIGRLRAKQKAAVQVPYNEREHYVSR